MSDTTEDDSGGELSRDAAPFGLDPSPDPDSDTDLRFDGHIEQYDDAPDECTIFPRTASAEFPRMTTWLTAQEGSYCLLEECR